MPRRTDDDVEGDLDDDGRLDLVVPAEPGDGVRLEPACHLRDLGVGEAAVRLADVDELARLRVADGKGVVRQHAVALAMPDLDADDDAVDCRERLLHLQPAQATAAGDVPAL